MPATNSAGRVAVVTGAARGIGAAVARDLSARGLALVLVGREPRLLEEVAGGLPGPSCWVEADVTDEAAMRRAAATCRERFAEASVVVANAGIAATGPFTATDPALWRRVIEVNLVGSAVTARAFLPQLAHTRGYLLQIASSAAFGPAPMMSAYGASKAGVESFARALRAEVAPQGIGVGIAYLHWTRTDMIGDMDAHPVLHLLRTRQPLLGRRVSSPAQVAARLGRGVQRRSPTVYAPPWLRVAQPLRPLLPHLFTPLAGRALNRLPPDALRAATGVLGPGGHADWDAQPPGERATPPRP